MKKALILLLLLPFIALSETNATWAVNPLNGTYTVGTGGSFTTLTAAVAALNANGVSGPVTFKLTNATYSVATGETFPLTINAINGSSAVNTVTFRPSEGVNTTVEAKNQTINNNLAPAPAVFVLKGADYVTFNGSNVAGATTKNLTLKNANSVYDDSARAVIWVAANGSDAATYITVQNTTLKGYPSSNSKYNGGVYSGAYGLGGSNGQHISISEAGANNSNLTVTNNTFIDVRNGVYVNAGSATATNLTVSKNDFGGYSSSNSVRLSGAVILKNVNGFTVTENSIHDIIQDFSDSDLAVRAAGIHIGGASKEGVISKNNIKSLIRTSNNSYQLAGIALESTVAASNILVVNNFVNNISTDWAGDTAQASHGISVVKGGGYKIYFNTVGYTNSQNGGFSTCLYVGANAGSNIDVRNNIFSNKQTNSSANRLAILIIKEPSQLGSVFTALNYNALSAQYIGYSGTNANWTGNNGNTNYQTSLSGWKSTTNRDLNSLDASPVFVSATDLHLAANNPVNATLVGSSAVPVTKDIDGGLRTTPTMGAHEYGATIYDENTICDNSTTWNGTSWSNGAPTVTVNAIFKANYTQNTGTLNACSVYVLNNATVLFTGNSTANVVHSVNVEANGSLTFDSGSVLLQTTNDANSGLVTVKRTSGKLKRLDYTLWCAPVFDSRTTGFQTLKQFSPLTLSNRYYTYSTADSFFTSVDATTTKFELAKGYLIRMPNSDDATGYNGGTARMIYTGVFTGTPNNGNISLPLAYTDATNAYNITGNPYPSSISVKRFINANADAIDGTVWLWRKTNNAAESSYCTANLTGYVGNKAPGGGGINGNDGNDLIENPFVIAPNEGALNAGQGFFVKATASNKQLNFNNSIRIASSTASFFKSAQTEETAAAEDFSRVWLNVADANNTVFAQTLIGYNALSTLGEDFGYDSKMISQGSLSMYTVRDTATYAIQTRGNFNVADQVQLGFAAATAGTYTISIDTKDGVFAQGTKVLLVDNAYGIIRNLTENNFTFETEAGTFNDRFTVVYAAENTDETLGNAPIKEITKETMVYQQNGQVKVVAPTNVKAIVVYDLLGKVLYQNNTVNNVEFATAEINASQQMVVANVTLDNGQVVSKKIMMN